MEREEIDKEIKRLNFVIKDLQKRGEEALHEIDKPKGVEGALKILQDDLDYFTKKRGETAGGITN